MNIVTLRACLEQVGILEGRGFLTPPLEFPMSEDFRYFGREFPSPLRILAHMDLREVRRPPISIILIQVGSYTKLI